MMMTSSTGNIVQVTGPLLVDSPHEGLWHGTLMFFSTAPKQTVEQTIETPGILDAIASP